MVSELCTTTCRMLPPKRPLAPSRARGFRGFLLQALPSLPRLLLLQPRVERGELARAGKLDEAL